MRTAFYDTYRTVETGRTPSLRRDYFFTMRLVTMPFSVMMRVK